MDNPEVYFQFKPFYKKYTGEKALLGDFIELAGPENLKEKIECIIVFPNGINTQVRLTAVQIVQLIQQEVPGIAVIPIGESSALYEPKQRSKENPVLLFLRVAFSMVLLFIGAALAIMYFHSDVDMNKAHQIIYYFITGEKVDNPVLFTVSYSLGIGMGIAIFLDIFAKMKNKENPGPLELEMHQSEKELREYLRDQEGKKQN
ncbi:MAG TPA: hypothetical protein GX505_06665 [Clostridiales bacterium]|nr:hypothetical protein [Clostridiales bacterium]